MMGIPFHADFSGNVVYPSSKTSVIAMENILCLSVKIGVVRQISDCWFLHWAFRGQWYDVMALGWW